MEAAAPPPQQQAPAPEVPPAARNRYPPGYRFMPTDSELILHYLQKKVNNEPIPISDMKETNLKQSSPKALTEAYPKIGDNDWYFFTPRDRKYPNGTRPDRAADNGYWKATGADKKVEFEGRVIGFRKALVFYEGRAQQGVKTGWIMHEYRLNQSPRTRDENNPRDMRLDDWVLCKIYEKAMKPNSSKRKRGNRKDSARVNDDDEIETNHDDDDEIETETNHLEEDETLTTVTNHHQQNMVDNQPRPLIQNHDAVVNYSYQNVNQNVNPAFQDQRHYHHQEPAVVNAADCFRQQDLLQFSAPHHHHQLQLQHHQDLSTHVHHQKLLGDGVVFDDDLLFDHSGVDHLIGNNNNDHNIYLNEQDQGFGFNGGGGDACIKNENCFVPSSDVPLQSFSWNEASYSAFLPSDTNNINCNFGDAMYSNVGVDNYFEEDKGKKWTMSK